MKVVVIGDETFVSGFVLAGVEGYVKENPKEVIKLIKKLINNKEIGMILINESISEKIQKEINEIKRKIHVPIIYEIPGPTSPKKIIDYRKLLREMLGV